MHTTRREALHSAFWIAAALGTGAPGAIARAANSGTAFTRIATEESFMTREVFGGYLELLANEPESEPGFAHFFETALGTPGELIARLSSVVGGENTADLVNWISRSAAAMGSEASVTALARQVRPRCGTAAHHGRDRRGQAGRLAGDLPVSRCSRPRRRRRSRRGANDQLAAGIRANPDRLAGLAAIAPQSPSDAARELERAVTELGLSGVMINSHTKGEYLDEPKFRPILAKAEELRVPLYLHPRTPSAAMLEPFTRYPGLAAATFGFSVETGLHALRLILGGIFDDHPGLTVVLGHMGEGLPFWIDRVDNRTAFIQTGPGPKPRKLRKRPSEYLRENFYVTTSGMDFEPALMLAHKVVGPDRILFAIDYPMEDGAHPVRVIDEAPISDDDKTKIYQTNAERVFGLG